MKHIILGGGCFWCIEPVFQQLDGVSAVTSGYTGGHVKNPTYEDICTKQSGHIEVIKVDYDEGKVTLETLLQWFLKSHDPTQPDGQGADRGPQYLSAIFAPDEATLERVKAYLAEAQKDYPTPFATQVRPEEVFYPAEGYHQNYYNLNKMRNPYCQVVITPKLDKLGLQS